MLECTITETKNIEPVVYDWGQSSGSPIAISTLVASRASDWCTFFLGRPTLSIGIRTQRRSFICSRANATSGWVTGM